MTDITWNKNGDDYTAIVGEYEFYINQEFGEYFWLIYTGDKSYDINSVWVFANTLESAKEAAVNAYKDHVNKSH